jgi:perosamine synthetase
MKTRVKLVVNGGLPVRKKKWLGNFTTSKAELNEVKKVFNTGYLSLFEGSYKTDPPFSFNGGPFVKNFEKKWANNFNSNYAVSFNSATSCLYSSIGALNIGYGDEVIVSPYTMTASAIAPLIYGAIPVFADVEKYTGCIDPASIKKLISRNTKAILVVHQFGFPAKMDEILYLAKKYGLKIIEDCAQAIGTKYKGKLVGTFGDIGVFSLNVNKNIQSGEGGVCITNSKDLNFRLQLIRNHGENVVEKAKYKNISNIVGFNYRMTEITAAIASVQLKKLKKLNNRRYELVNYFRSKILDFDFLKFLDLRPECRTCNCLNLKSCVNSYYVSILLFNSKLAGMTRKRFVNIANKEGASIYEGYTKPLYLQPLYQKQQLFKKGMPFSAKANKYCRKIYSKGTSPNAERLFSKELIMTENIRPPHNFSDIDDLIKIFKKIKKYIKNKK